MLAVRLPTVTMAVMLPPLVPVPEVVRPNHDPLQFTDADQFRLPPPVLLTVMFWLAGLLPPCTAVKVIDVGLNPMVGDGIAMVAAPPTVRFTVLFWYEALAPVMPTE
jgi:hypothetical protein